ncbi:uncharacterized protein LOC116299707 [Actinia tenebrosa]|uniref:Uncharacterized protein LOC116299707 n=1 Tax=Actinia tenebrosa TaxID=6105 RepID=A0A6P8IEI4_ACTTE|nr:uncharacterized protein LOC116299707 [Actinia tenebrosa]
MKDVRCELLDEDKASKAADFVDETGYVYYDLQQTLYKGNSFTVRSSDVCYNGCCRTQPCLNGGTSVEHCEKPKVKFSCKYPATYKGNICEKREFSSCIDVFNGTAPGTIPANGTYIITRSDTKTTVPVYCAFESPNQAWTVIESFSLQNKDYFKNQGLHQDYPKNQESFSWNHYRLSLGNMKYFQSRSSLFRATCDYDKRSSLTPDFLLGLLRVMDITSSEPFNNKCKKYLHININGDECFNCTTKSYKPANEHFHIDPSGCQFNPTSDFPVADYFGFYLAIDPVFKCTATQQSTTQWWLGEQQ